MGPDFFIPIHISREHSVWLRVGVWPELQSKGGKGVSLEILPYTQRYSPSMQVQVSFTESHRNGWMALNIFQRYIWDSTT